jgi:hypothetical protein
MKQSCSAANVATKSLATMKNSIDTLEFIRVKNHLVVYCVANLFHRKELWLFTINIFILMAIKWRGSAAHSVENSLFREKILTDIWEFIQAKNHTAVHCVDNHLQGETHSISICEFTPAKNHTVVYCVAKHLQRETDSISIWKFTPAKKLFSSTLCDKSFSHRNQINQHKRVHTWDINYMVAQCVIHTKWNDNSTWCTYPKAKCTHCVAYRNCCNLPRETV